MLLTSFAAQRRRGIDQQTKYHGAIIARQLDQIGLRDEPAKLDQLTRALTAFHLPSPRVMPCPLRLKPVAGLHRSPMRRPRSG